MINRTAQEVKGKCTELRKFWAPRNSKMRKWYRLIQMVDELKTTQMESFVGNDPRAMFNLVLHMLTPKIPHRLDIKDMNNFELADAALAVSELFDMIWGDNEQRFRRSGPRQDLWRANNGMLLSTGWYAMFAMNSDDGQSSYIDIWNPIEVFPMWDWELGLSEVAHIYPLPASACKRMAQRNNWKLDARGSSKYDIYDYWWVEYEVVGVKQVWNAVVVGDTLVKFEPTRFKRIPIYTAPVGGLPDTGPLSEGTELSTASYNAGSTAVGERWKEEIGQGIVATNENIYKAWNKWWTFSLQLLRDTAQPRVFERSRSGKPIVRPEEVFRRGAIFRGGPEDSVEFIGSPPIPLELRTSQLDMEAMMQRGGVSWALYGNVQGQMTAYVMSQIAASANQIMRPFHQAIIDLTEDVDNDLFEDVLERGVRPYGWKMPPSLPPNPRIIADYDIEIPGDLIHRATVGRMLDPDFRLSYTYVLKKLFPDIKNPLRQRAEVLADQAQLHPTNALIALVQYYRQQAAYLESIGDTESAKLYDMAAQATEAQIAPQPQQPQPQQPVQAGRSAIGGRPESTPQLGMPQMPAA